MVPEELACRIVLLKVRGQSDCLVARALLVDRRTVKKVYEYWLVHDHVPRAVEPHADRLLDDADLQYLSKLVAECPTIYLDEYQTLLARDRDRSVSLSTLFRALEALGTSVKKLTKLAAEADAVQQAQFVVNLQHFRRDQLVFMDEVHTSRLSRQRKSGRSPVGQPVWSRSFFVRGTRYSTIGLLHQSGILGQFTQEGSLTADDLVTCANDLLVNVLQRWPAPRSVLVLDNCSIHRNPLFLATLAAAGILVLFLPPYSPRFNPIELAFAQLKRDIQRQGAELAGFGFNGYGIIEHAFEGISSAQCEAYIAECGY